MPDDAWFPARRPEVVLRRDPVRGEDLVIQPERLARLNSTAATILRLCDGTRSVDDICIEVGRAYPDAPAATVAASVARFLASARTERWIR